MTDNDVVFIDVANSVAVRVYSVERRGYVPSCSYEKREICLRERLTATSNAVQFMHGMVAREFGHREAGDWPRSLGKQDVDWPGGNLLEICIANLRHCSQFCLLFGWQSVRVYFRRNAFTVVRRIKYGALTTLAELFSKLKLVAEFIKRY
ncbi:hypothetical protein WJ09_18405 [Burkholderia vietnamiensis]|nr:hypothetical protein WJ09_18405 [Burkholderia vietnamiensis]